MIASIREMLRRLRAHPDVVGLVEYGSRRSDDAEAEGDYDVFVVLDVPAVPVEGIHFYVGPTPVDMNLRTLAEMRAWEVLEGFDGVLLRSRVLYDPTGTLAPLLERLRHATPAAHPVPLSAHGVARIRHQHRHLFDKLRNRREARPVFCHHLLAHNVHELVQNYFPIRGLEYQGEARALPYLRGHDPDVFAALAAFYEAPTLERRIAAARDLARRVLDPVGGLWRDDEVLAFGEDAGPRLQERGRAVYARLFGAVPQAPG